MTDRPGGGGEKRVNEDGEPGDGGGWGSAGRGDRAFQPEPIKCGMRDRQERPTGPLASSWVSEEKRRERGEFGSPHLQM